MTTATPSVEPGKGEEAVATETEAEAEAEGWTATPKDLVVIGFVLCLWLYSVVLMFRAWNRILNFSEDQLRPRTEKAAFLWKWVLEHILLQKRGQQQQSHDVEVGSQGLLHQSSEQAQEKPQMEEDSPVVEIVDSDDDSGRSGTRRKRKQLPALIQPQLSVTDWESSVATCTMSAPDEIATAPMEMGATTSPPAFWRSRPDSLHCCGSPPPMSGGRASDAREAPRPGRTSTVSLTSEASGYYADKSSRRMKKSSLALMEMQTMSLEETATPTLTGHLQRMKRRSGRSEAGDGKHQRQRRRSLGSREIE